MLLVALELSASPSPDRGTAKVDTLHLVECTQYYQEAQLDVDMTVEYGAGRKIDVVRKGGKLSVLPTGGGEPLAVWDSGEIISEVGKVYLGPTGRWVAIEFATHREYAPGDDLRHIDWKVWSKTDRLYIKEYEEETNLKCHILLDCSKSMRYGESTGWSKYDYAATAAASLAYLMQQQQDAVGLITFSNQIDLNLKASSHPSHLKLIFQV